MATAISGTHRYMATKDLPSRTGLRHSHRRSLRPELKPVAKTRVAMVIFRYGISMGHLPFPRFAETDDLPMAGLLPLTHAIMSMKMKTSQ